MPRRSQIIILSFYAMCTLLGWVIAHDDGDDDDDDAAVAAAFAAPMSGEKK